VPGRRVSGSDRRRVSVRRLADAAAVAVALGLAVAAAAAATAPAPLAFGPAFTLASGFQQDYGAGPSALGPDGTVWLVQPGFGDTPGSTFEIIARAANGSTPAPVTTSDGAGSATDRPAIATGRGSAAFVWETSSNLSGAAGTTQVRARSCTLAGCGAVQVLAQWRWSAGGPIGSSGFTAVGDAEPAVATAEGRVVAVFERAGGGAPRMEWAVANGGRFGPVRALGGPAGPVAVAAADARGGVVAAWIAGDLSSSGRRIVWASWSAGGGFTRPQTLAGAIDAGLVTAPAGAGVALAWLEGAGAAGPVAAGPLWLARRGASGAFSRPLRVFAGDAADIALAGASGTLALAYTTVAGAGANPPTPAWVTRSAGAAPFGRALELDATAQPHAAVAVLAGGGVLAAWSACGRRATTCAAMLALAAPGGPFAAPRSLGGEDRGDAPAIHAAGARALVTWESGENVQGVIAAG